MRVGEEWDGFGERRRYKVGAPRVGSRARKSRSSDSGALVIRFGQMSVFSSSSAATGQMLKRERKMEGKRETAEE